MASMAPVTSTRVTRDQARGEIRRHSVYQIVPLCAGMLMMIGSGSVYVVGSYDADLQTKLGMSNSQVTGFGTLVSAGAWLSLIPMIFMEHFGPKVTVLIGTTVNLIGYIVLSAAGYGSDISIDVVMLMAFVVGFGAAWTQAAAFVTNSVNCLPRHRGVVVGLLQASCAFSGGLFSVINEIFGFSVQFFMLFIGITMFISILVAYPSNHRVHHANNNLFADTLFVFPLVIATFVTGILIMWATITDDEGLLILVFVLFCTFFAGVARMSILMIEKYGAATIVPFPPIQKDADDYFDLINFDFMDIDNNVLRKQDDENATVEEATPLMGSSEPEPLPEAPSTDVEIKATEEGEAPATTTDAADDATAARSASTEEGGASTETTQGGDDVSVASEVSASSKVPDGSFTVWEAVKTPQFWLFYIEFGILVGVNTAISDSVSDIIDAYSSDGGYVTLKDNAQSLFSVFSGLGRLIFGMSSDYLVFHYGISRYTLLSLCFFILIGDCILLAYVELPIFNLTMILAGFSYGGAVTMVGTITLDFFGGTNFGVIYGCINTAAIVGTELFYGLAMSELYNYYNSSSGVCYDNRACFKTTFWIFASFCMIGFCISEYLSQAHETNKAKRS